MPEAARPAAGGGEPTAVVLPAAPRGHAAVDAEVEVLRRGRAESRRVLGARARALALLVLFCLVYAFGLAPYVVADLFLERAGLFTDPRQVRPFLPWVESTAFGTPLYTALLALGPPVALVVAAVAGLFLVSCLLRLREAEASFRSGMAELSFRRRAVSLPDGLPQLEPLGVEVREFCERHGRLAAHYGAANAVLVTLGLCLSALVTVSGALGAAAPAGSGTAVLGAALALVIGAQSYFRTGEKARFERQVAAEGERLLGELLYEVDEPAALRAVLRRFQDLRTRYAQDAPSERDLAEAAGQGSAARRDRAASPRRRGDP